MSMRITEYLLKPIDENELMRAITRMICEIKEEEAGKAYRKVKDRLLNESLPQLKTKLMQNVLDGTLSDNNELLKRGAALNFSFNDQDCEYRIILIDASYAAQESENEMETLRFSIANISEELINNAASGLLSYCASNEFTGLICGCAAQGLDELSQSIQYALKKHLDVSACIAIGAPVRDIADIHISYEDAVSVLDEKRHKGKRNYVQIVLRYVEERFNTDISLAEAAGVAFVSPNYLSRVFKEEMKMSFVDWLNQLRVDKAKEMLLHTNLKTYEVAENVGYKDYKYFSSVFRKNTGVLPRDYRRKPPTA